MNRLILGTGHSFLQEGKNSLNILKNLLPLVDTIDTSELYKLETEDTGIMTEHIIGQAIKKKWFKPKIISKVGPQNLKYQDVIKSCNGSLKRLGISCLEGYLIHWPNPDVSMQETVCALRQLQREGKVKHIGACNLTSLELIEFEQVGPINMLQYEYSLFEDSFQGDISNGSCPVLCYSSLSNNYLMTRGLKEKLTNLASDLNMTRNQLILNYLYGHYPNYRPVIATDNPYHWIENENTFHFKPLSQDILTGISGYLKNTSQIINMNMNNLFFEARAVEDTESPSLDSLAKFYYNGGMMLKTPWMKEGKFIRGKRSAMAWALAFKGEKELPVKVFE